MWGRRVCAHEYWCPQGPEEGLELELQIMVSCVTWVLGAQLRSLVKRACFSNSRATSPASAVVPKGPSTLEHVPQFHSSHGKTSRSVDITHLPEMRSLCSWGCFEFCCYKHSHTYVFGSMVSFSQEYIYKNSCSYSKPMKFIFLRNPNWFPERLPKVIRLPYCPSNRHLVKDF